MSQALKRKMASDRKKAAEAAAALANIRAEAKANAEVIGAAWAAATNPPWLPTNDPISPEPAEWFH